MQRLIHGLNRNYPDWLIYTDFECWVFVNSISACVHTNRLRRNGIHQESFNNKSKHMHKHTVNNRKPVVPIAFFDDHVHTGGKNGLKNAQPDVK